MKTSFIIIFAVAVLALAYAASVEDNIPRLYNECRAADAITPLKLCMNVKVGIMNANGDIDRNGLKAFLLTNPKFDSTVVDDIVAHCAEKGVSIPAEAPQALDKCMKERYLIHHPGTTFSD